MQLERPKVDQMVLGTSVSNLLPAQQKFKRKLDAMGGTLKRARIDPEPAFTICC